MIMTSTQLVSEVEKEAEEVIWRVVPKSLRPNHDDYVSSGPETLFVVRQDWKIELVGLTESGKLDVQELNVEEPMLFAPLS